MSNLTTIPSRHYHCCAPHRYPRTVLFVTIQLIKNSLRLVQKLRRADDDL